MNIEMLGVEFVRLAINKTDYLVQHINDNDREPSWDGDVEVYRKAGNTHAKADLILKVPVQIKGHVAENLRKQSISYSVELSDLRNYLNAGGTTFIVVYIDKEGEKSQIYYNTLLPYELKRLVCKYGEQKSKNIVLKALPKKKNEIADVFLFAATHIKRQRPAISCDPISMDTLVKQGHVPELSFGYTRVPDNDVDPFDYMFDHGTYIYAKFPFGLELPVKYVPHIDAAGTTFHASVSVNGHVHYSQYEIIQSKNTLEHRFGKGTRLFADRNSGARRFTFCEEGTLSQRITDLAFILEAIENGQFSIEDEVHPLTAINPEELEAIDIAKRKAHLKWLKTIKAMLDKLGVAEELDCDSISEEDDSLIKKLVAAILYGKSVEWLESDERFPEITIANLRIKLCVLKDDKNHGYNRIFGYSDAPIWFVIKDKDGNEIEASYHVFLKRASMLTCCNINYTSVIQQLKSIPISVEYSGALVWLLLEMLCAYDESGSTRKDILAGATELAEWLRSADPHTHQDLLDLNYYQAVKRSRELSTREIQGLHSIIDSRPARRDVYVGAYLLLGDYASAKHHYDSMEDEERDIFNSYPISHFSQKTNSLSQITISIDRDC